MLSYSTLGSGKGEDVDKMRTATQLAKERYPELDIDGELQFDAAVSPRVAKTKCPNSTVAGHANTFIFPDINAGNIGYKIAQRLGGFDAYGPILLGLNAPINDLSRGCNAQEVYSMAIITAALAYGGSHIVGRTLCHDATHCRRQSWMLRLLASQINIWYFNLPLV